MSNPWLNTLLKSIILSSKDPAKVSLTLRGILLQVVPVILVVSKLYGIETLDESALTALAEVITEIVAGVLSLVSVVMIAWGLVRKIFAR